MNIQSALTECWPLVEPFCIGFVVRPCWHWKMSMKADMHVANFAAAISLTMFNLCPRDLHMWTSELRVPKALSSNLRKLTIFRCPELNDLEGLGEELHSLSELVILKGHARPYNFNVLKDLHALRKVHIDSGAVRQLEAWLEVHLPRISCHPVGELYLTIFGQVWSYSLV